MANLNYIAVQVKAGLTNWVKSTERALEFLIDVHILIRNAAHTLAHLAIISV